MTVSDDLSEDMIKQITKIFITSATKVKKVKEVDFNDVLYTAVTQAKKSILDQKQKGRDMTSISQRLTSIIETLPTNTQKKIIANALEKLQKNAEECEHCTTSSLEVARTHLLLSVYVSGLLSFFFYY